MGLGIDADGYLLQIFTNQLKIDQTFYFLKLFKEWVPEVGAET
jgi:hypothetical protein